MFEGENPASEGCLPSNTGGSTGDLPGGNPVTTRYDLIVIAVSGVQQFITESRTTSDLSAGSAIVARLSARAARECASRGARLVFPAVMPPDQDSGAPITPCNETADSLGVPTVPNRIVALAPEGKGAEVAAAADHAVRQDWAGLVRKALGRPAATPGMPSVQWVSVPASIGDYARQWEEAQRLLVARKRIRAFDAVEEPDRDLCSLSPRWPAEPKPPKGVPAHERDRLAAANWVKRRYRHIGGAGDDGGPGEVPKGFPSTSSIASAPFRSRVLDKMNDQRVSRAVSALRAAVQVLDRGREQPPAALAAKAPATADGRWLVGSAGRWVYQDAWQEDVLAREFPSVPVQERTRAVANGVQAVRALHTALKAPKDKDVPPPLPHLAVVVQDLDGMGRFLGGEIAGSRRRNTVTEAWHREVSERLSVLARETCELLEGSNYFGVPVYAGGDDLLAFVPAAYALAAARAVRDAVPKTLLPTASTAVLFFHHRSPLQRAVSEAQHLLETAKKQIEGKNGLAVGYLRRSGVREQSLQAWTRTADGRGPVEDFEEFLSGPPGSGSGEAGRLSLRLVQDCVRDEAELVSLPDDLFAAEIRRLVTRHGGTRAQADALLRLAAAERSRPTPGRRVPRLAEPVKVAAFLRQECAGGGA